MAIMRIATDSNLTCICCDRPIVAGTRYVVLAGPDMEVQLHPSCSLTIRPLYRQPASVVLQDQ